MENFLLFCLGQTRSADLVEALRKHPEVRCAMEPFNLKIGIGDEETLASAIRELRLQYNGIAHVWDLNGWPFEGDADLNLALVLTGNQKVVYLNRRNVLKRLVSLQVSLNQRNGLAIQPLNIEEIQYFIEMELDSIAQYADMAAKAPERNLMLWYEDLFPEGEVSGAAAMEGLSRVLDFIGCGPVGPVDALRMRSLFALKPEPDGTEIFSQVPNIEEVEELCGSDETGWLFPKRGFQGFLRKPRPNFFVIYSPGRTGSTNLAKALNVHPEIRCCLEPFNSGHFRGKYLQRARDEAGLLACMEELRTRYNGIKHVWGHGGWPFLNGAGLNGLLANMPGQKLILLRRRNVLKRLVSLQVSEQTGLWNISGARKESKVQDFVFEPLDVPRLRFELRIDDYALRHAELLARHPGTAMTVDYEDLFPESDGTGDAALREIRRMVDFLGFDACGAATLERMRPFLTVSRRMNSRETYRLIPNIDEVEKALGSDETGWLLRE